MYYIFVQQLTQTKTRKVMKTKEKLSYNIYQDRFGNVYKMTDDETAIDIDNPLKSAVAVELMWKYKFVGQNNNFKIYQLRAKYLK